jgi:DNA polymerase/3'-5' exonuclease PolX
MSASVSKFIEILQRLSKISDGFRKVAFVNAINSLKKHEKETITREELVLMPKIGKGILTRFDELVQTGHLQELNGKEEEQSSLTLFENIYGIGPVLARKFYEKGYRKLSDIPIESLTSSQALGVRYYSDINSRIPRREIDEVAITLQKIVNDYNSRYKATLRVKICGSYLRGRESSGDIDIIISERDNKSFIDKFLDESKVLFHHILAKGNSKVLTLGGLKGVERRIDIEIVPHEDWAYALLYFTGSMNFNKHMRGIAKEQGYLLNQSGLFVGAAKLQLETEEEIFSVLKMKYLTPKERDEY